MKHWRRCRQPRSFPLELDQSENVDVSYGPGLCENSERNSRRCDGFDSLFHHGLIEQIPSITYAVTLARPRRVKTPLGTISFHRMPPELFSDFVLAPQSEAKIAIPEKGVWAVRVPLRVSSTRVVVHMRQSKNTF